MELVDFHETSKISAQGTPEPKDRVWALFLLIIRAADGSLAQACDAAWPG